MSRRGPENIFEQIQCLLFVIEDGSTDSSEAACDRRWKPMKGFVLLSSVIANNHREIRELFKRCNIQLLGRKECPTLLSALERDKVEIIELILLHDVEASASNTEALSRFQFSVETCNEDVVLKIFGRNAVISETQLNPGSVLNAVDGGNQNVMEYILSRKPFIRLRDPKNGTLLHLAAVRGDKYLVRSLIKHGVNVNIKSNERITPLHLATQFKNLQIVKFLLDKGASVNARQMNGATCLYLAAEGGCSEIFKFLLSRGGSISIGKYNGTMPLHVAAKNGHLEILKDLLQRGVDINARIARGCMKGCTPLYLAAEEGHRAIVQCLLKRRAEVNAVNHKGQSVLHAALNKKCAETVRCILSHRPNVDCPSGTKELALLDELILEKTTKFDDVLKLLVQHEFTVSSESIHSPKLLLRAISKNNVDVVRMLLEMGAEVNEVYAMKYGKYCHKENSATSLLHAAVWQSSGSMVQLLIEHGANVNLKTIRLKETPLEAAVDKSNLELIQLLLTNGAVVRSEAISKASVLSNAEIMKALLLNAVDIPVEILNLALFHAISKGNLEVVKVLLKFGAVIDAELALDGSSAVHLASDNGCDMVKFLIANNASLEIGDLTGKTPLFRAAMRGYRAVVNVLLSFGTPIDVLDMRGKSLLHHVVVHSQTDIFETLLDAFFQAPDSILNSNFWRIFDKSYLKDDDNIYQRYKRNKDYFKECSKIFERHLIKVKAANLDFNAGKVFLSWPFSGAEDFRSDCEAEIVCMKTLTIWGSGVTLYDILTKDVKQLASYLRNDTIHQVLESGDYKTWFPIYASVIDWQVKKGTQRRELLDEGLKICRHLFKNFLSLPLELRERIVDYLTDQHLLVLKYAVTGSVS